MKKVDVNFKTRLELTGIRGFIERKVTPSGNGAKINCPKEYLGRKVFIVILEEEETQTK